MTEHVPKRTHPAVLAPASRPDGCRRGAKCGGSTMTIAGQRYVGCGLAGCQHNWNATLGGCGKECAS